MKLISKLTTKEFVLKGFFEEDKIKEKNILKSQNAITEYQDKNLSYIFLGKKDDFDFESLLKTIKVILNLNTRNYQIDPSTFVNKKNTISQVVNTFIDQDEYINGNGLYSAKTTKKPQKSTLSILVSDKKIEEEIKTTLTIAKMVNNARRLQATPPNICNSEWLAGDIKSMFKNTKNVSIKVLTKKEIEKEKMNLFLSVNRGSAYEPRLVVIEYIGNDKSKEKIAYVGKGITFDSGGYNLKPSQHIQGMKYDMSGAAICASALKAITDLQPKVNICAVLPLTDNKISSSAQTPDSIWTSMNGKTVEINNTDAEGRLILADAITYAIRKCNATSIVDIATLTGAIVVALGSTYTGTWATSDKLWEKINKSAFKQNELLWRMPFHNDFLINIKKSNFADYKNTDLSGKGGSNSAAMFLKEFTENKEYIHLDIAGTGGNGENPTGIMTKTLVQFALDSQEK